jgi:imidazole glycerol phosphate synthase subunit HisF
MVEAFVAGATAAMIASILHDAVTTVTELKREIADAGIRVRP